MKAIISGATGFLGRHLVEECIKNEIETICIVRKIRLCNFDDHFVKQVTISELSNSYEIAKLLDGSEFFFHLAWTGTSGKGRTDIGTQLGNIEVLKECINIAAKAGCKKFINAGSIMEAEIMQRWMDRDAGYSLNDVYSVIKLSSDYLGRILAEDKGLKYVNLVISNIYGPNELSERFIYSVLKKMIRNERIPLTDCEQLYDFIYISDAIRAMIDVAVRGTGGSYYIGNKEQYPLRGFVMEMKEVTGSCSELGFGEIKKKAKDLRFNELNCSRLFDELGFSPQISFAEGIRNTAEYVRSLP